MKNRLQFVGLLYIVFTLIEMGVKEVKYSGFTGSLWVVGIQMDFLQQTSITRKHFFQSCSSL